MLALFALVARRLPRGLVPLVLPLLGLTLLAQVLSLAATTLLAALRSGAVLYLRAAGLFTARHLLGLRYADSRQ